jgi:thiol-disulfide isomerase/thioredoxin
VPPGWLPPFTDAQNDTAVAQGYVLGDVKALSYYDGAEVGYQPSDGRSRVWVIWAHWCPYCQQELPALSEWWVANADRYPNTDLVTISTSEDPSRGNPLLAYLDESQFPFPVLVDGDLALAQQFGTSAFPYWVVTGPDGRVLLRLAGQIGIQTTERLFDEVEAVARTS